MTKEENRIIYKQVRERQYYKELELIEKFSLSRNVIERLLAKRLLIKKKKDIMGTIIDDTVDDSIDDDTCIDDDDSLNYRYCFTFVGVLYFKAKCDDVQRDYIIISFPKYLSQNYFNSKMLSQIMKVIYKYKSSLFSKEISSFCGEDIFNDKSDVLDTCFFLLNDYFENGIYTCSEHTLELNGEGEIFWDKTINELSPFIIRKDPYYVDLITTKNHVNEHDYIRELHEYIITNICKELEQLGLLELFGFLHVDLSEEEQANFGDDDYILSRIDGELMNQFVTRKQNVLKAMRIYIKNDRNLFRNVEYVLLGTRYFQFVWEAVCKAILGDQSETKIRNLSLRSIPVAPSNATLLDIIEKPYWTFTNNFADNTLRPDILVISNNALYILDAKYYTPLLEKSRKPRWQPGIEDIIKQYIYQRAYSDLIHDNRLIVFNCFLMPTEKNRIEKKGTVKLNMLSSVPLNDIDVRFIPATEAYDLYLNDEKLNLLRLELS